MSISDKEEVEVLHFRSDKYIKSVIDNMKNNNNRNQDGDHATHIMMNILLPNQAINTPTRAIQGRYYTNDDEDDEDIFEDFDVIDLEKI